MKVLKIITKDFTEVEPFLGNNKKYVSTEEGYINLIVGWDLAKENGAKILNHKINENTYWTFLPREKRDLFKKHISDFIKKCYDDLTSEVKIKNLNPLEYEEIKVFLSFIKKQLSGGTTYLYSDKLYTYKNNTIYHIDLGLLQFIGWDIIPDIMEISNPIKINEKDFKDDLKYLNKKYIPLLVNAKENLIISNVC